VRNGESQGKRVLQVLPNFAEFKQVRINTNSPAKKGPSRMGHYHFGVAGLISRFHVGGTGHYTARCFVCTLPVLNALILFLAAFRTI
jgi:hypothetical protein